MTLRVLIVSSEFLPGPGGIGTHAFELARHLTAWGHRVEVLACQDYVDDHRADAFNRSQPFGITRFSDIGGRGRMAATRLSQIRAAIRHHRPDAVIASGGHAVWMVAALGAGGTPWMAVAHGSELGGSAPSRAVTRWAFGRADVVVAVSEFTGRRVLARGIRARRLVVVPNGADVDRFRPDALAGARFRAVHDLGTDPVVLTVGSVSERKGQHRVVAALPQVVAAVPDVRYVLVGRGHDAGSIRRLARELGVDRHVVLLDQLDAAEVACAYDAADVFALTSTETATGDVEGFGIAIVEAALSGVPAVVSAQSGPVEAIRPGVTGIAVDPDDARAVAGALVSLLTDPDRRRRMGAAARTHALEEQTWPDRVRRYEALLTDLGQSRSPRPSRLLVVSHTPHHRGPEGVVGFGPTVRELDQLSSLFDELVHVAPLQRGVPPGNALRYHSDRVRFVPVRDAGGNRAVDKVRAGLEIPRWAATIWAEAGRADAVHVRTPAAISLVALAVLAVRRRPELRWFKYAGNWRPERPDARAYRVQRWWLARDLSRGEVTVNGRWTGDGPHVQTFDNPTLTDAELARSSQLAEVKSLQSPLELVFVGRLEAEKGADIAVDVAEELAARGHAVRLRLVGDGPLGDVLARRSDHSVAGSSIELLGWRTREEVEEVLATAHLMLLPTTAAEGFPKVLGEALAFGVVPITSRVSSIPQVLAEVGAGRASPDLRPASLASLIEATIASPEAWARESRHGAAGAARFSYRAYLDSVRRLADDRWHVDL